MHNLSFQSVSGKNNTDEKVNINTLTNQDANNEDNTGISNINDDTINVQDNMAQAGSIGMQSNDKQENVDINSENNLPSTGTKNTDTVNNVNINSNLNNNGLDAEETSVAPAGLPLHIGNSTVGDACQLSKEMYHQILQYYPQHCQEDDR